MADVFAGRSGAERIRAGVDYLSTRRPSPTDLQSAWEVLGPLFLRESGTGRDLVRKAVAQRRADVAVGALPHLLFHLARDDATTDQWARAEAGYGEAIALAREIGQLTELAASLAGLAWLAGRQGRADACRDLAAEAMTVATSRGVNLASAWARFAVAELDLSNGRASAAAEQFAELAEWLDRLGVLDVDLSPVPELVEALLRSGRANDGRQAASTYIDRAQTKGQPWARARAARVRGMVGDADSEAAFEEALALHAATLDRFEEARTRLVFGEWLRRARRRVDARVQLRTALDTFERLGAQIWADLTLVELRATGVSAQRRTTGPVVDLTARELQIALLLAEGKTTRQAAEALFVSPKTVEYHLRHVYTKLGIGSRSELTDRMRGYLG
jgi:DNA-binding CsgD family transcriptional regulator